MCGILGYKMIGSEVNPDALDFFEKLFLQSQIRGKHASGASFVIDEKIYTYKMSLPAQEYLKTDRWLKIKYTKPTEMVAHTRYSTSGPPQDNLNNQPIASPSMSIVHNGLVSMASKEEFEADYGVSCQTYNDTEILLQRIGDANEGVDFADAIANGLNDVHAVNPPIFACGFLNFHGTVTCVRDHIRPLWLFYIRQWGMVGFCSTKDIFDRASKRSSLDPSGVAIWEAQPYTVYSLGRNINRCAVSLEFKYPTEHRFVRPVLVDSKALANSKEHKEIDNKQYVQGDHRTNLRESFKRYSAASIRSWEIDPNYPLMNYLFRRYELSKSQEYWACFLYGVFYHPGTVFYVMQEFPEFEKVDLGRLRRWHAQNWKQLRYNKDRKYEKGHFVEMVESYLQVIGGQTSTSQEEFFDNLLVQGDKHESFRRVTKALLRLLRFGRYSVYIYTECLARCMGLPIMADNMFLRQADSPRAGLCYVLGKPEWCKGKLTEEQWHFLETAAVDLMNEIADEYPDVGIDQWFMESCLCAYKGFFHNGRYLGYYIHRMADEILQMQQADSSVVCGIDWNVLWQFRKEQLPWEYLGEYQKPPILKIKNEWRHTLAETGYMIGMWPMIRRGVIPNTPVQESLS